MHVRLQWPRETDGGLTRRQSTGRATCKRRDAFLYSTGKGNLDAARAASGC